VNKILVFRTSSMMWVCYLLRGFNGVGLLIVERLQWCGLVICWEASMMWVCYFYHIH